MKDLQMTHELGVRYNSAFKLISNIGQQGQISFQSGKGGIGICCNVGTIYDVRSTFCQKTCVYLLLNAPSYITTGLLQIAGAYCTKQRNS